MASPAFDVCVVGSANLDLVTTVARHPAPGETLIGDSYHEYPGGKGLNQAVAAARSDATVTFVGAVGCDSAGSMLTDVMHADGIDTTSLAVTDEPTGRALIVVAESGENSIVVVPGANARVDHSSPLPRTSVVLSQLEVPQAAVKKALIEARRFGATTILNPAPAAELPDELLAACTVVVPNEHEIALLGGVDRLLQAGCETVLVTRGGAGVDIHQGSNYSHQPAFSVPVVDTTGAGDAFCGALASQLASGHEMGTAVRWAAAAGALATTVAGAVPAQPTAAAIRQLLRQG